MRIRLLNYLSRFLDGASHRKAFACPARQEPRTPETMKGQLRGYSFRLVATAALLSVFPGAVNASWML